jgi:fructose-1,6-bisphosphatase
MTGGLSLTGMKRIMDIKPKDVHQRVPCIMGSPEDVLEMKKYYDNCDDPEIINRCNSRSA